MVNAGDLAVGASATMTYTYTSGGSGRGYCADERGGSKNRDTDIGTGNPMRVESNKDTAMILVEKIPETGETSAWTRGLGGAALLMAGTAGVVTIRRRKQDKEETEA
jgi:LPXTG-motif cell wall-anchored protein